MFFFFILLTLVTFVTADQTIWPDRKPASEFTIQHNQKYRKGLAFEDVQDFEDATRGLVATLPDGKITLKGETVWDLSQYDFITSNSTKDDSPNTVNPSLWRMAKLNVKNGLFEVSPGLWQVRGFDMSVMSIIKGDVGFIVVDPVISWQVAQVVWKDLVVPNLGNRPITHIIYTHSHADHFGGVRGLVSDDDVASGKVKIWAPSEFTEAAVGENIIAGNTMSRRAMYMYGSLLQKSSQGQVDGGLGKGMSTGGVTLIVPTNFVKKTGETQVLDGVEMQFLMAPESEAPSEFMFYLPKWKALCTAEDATHTLHNLYTLRGAKVRDGLLWSKYLQEALDMFPDADIIFASHHWPTWGKDRCVQLLKSQRDVYRYLHDQTLRLANHGYKPTEIAEKIQLPPSLGRVWANRGYYGSVHHNVRAQYNLRLGFYDANPSSLHPLEPREAGLKYVQALGGYAKVLKLGQLAYNQGEYRWAAELLNHAVYSNPKYQPARNLLADVYDQLGYQAESAPWRNFYLTAGDELRRGIIKMASPNSANPDTIRAMPMDLFLDYMGVRLNGDKAKDVKLEMVLEMTDTKETFEVGVENSALHYSKVGRDVRRRRRVEADVTVVTTRKEFDNVMLGKTTLKDLISSGKAQVKGDGSKFGEFSSLLDTFDIWFDVITGVDGGATELGGGGWLEEVKDEIQSSTLVKVLLAAIVGLLGSRMV